MNAYHQPQQPATGPGEQTGSAPSPPPPPTYHLVPITLNGPPPPGAQLPPDYPKTANGPAPPGYPIPIHLPPGYHLVSNLPHDERGRPYVPTEQDKARAAAGQGSPYFASAAELYSHVQTTSPNHRNSSPSSETNNEEGGIGANHYPSASSSSSQPQPQSSASARLPPILQVEKAQVTTSATQVASASRRRNDANFECPVPGCGSTFTRRFNLRGHLRSHTEERPYICSWPGCGKGFARQHDCKRHQGLHTAKSQGNTCRGCSKSFSRLDALNRHLRSDTGIECRGIHEAAMAGKPIPGSPPSQQEREDDAIQAAEGAERDSS